MAEINLSSDVTNAAETAESAKEAKSRVEEITEIKDILEEGLELIEDRPMVKKALAQKLGIDLDEIDEAVSDVQVEQTDENKDDIPSESPDGYPLVELRVETITEVIETTTNQFPVDTDNMTIQEALDMLDDNKKLINGQLKGGED